MFWVVGGRDNTHYVIVSDGETESRGRKLFLAIGSTAAKSVVFHPCESVLGNVTKDL